MSDPHARKVALFGALGDPQVTHVAKLLRARGHQVLAAPPELWSGDGSEGHSLYIGQRSARAEVGGEDLLQADAAWIRHLPPPFPTIDTRPELAPMERADIFVHAMNARERCATALAIVDALLEGGRTVINPPARGLGIQNKPSQLLAMARAGVRVPETLVTDSPRDARAFAQGRRLIYKPTTGGALTRVLDAAMLEALELIVAAPVIFQEQVPGHDVRVTVADGQVISAVVVESAEGTVDFRADPLYAEGRGSYRPLELPEVVRRAVLTTAEVLGLRFTGIDVRLDPAHPEAYAVLEANPSPTYLDVEWKTGHAISEALIDLLVR